MKDGDIGVTRKKNSKDFMIFDWMENSKLIYDESVMTFSYALPTFALLLW